MTRIPFRTTPLIVLALALAACAGALEAPPAHARPPALAPTTHWPQVWHDDPVPSQADFAVPRFSPPTAGHCRRPPSTREVHIGGRTQGHILAEREPSLARADDAPGGRRFSKTAPATSAPASVGAAAPAESRVADALKAKAGATAESKAERHAEPASPAAPAKEFAPSAEPRPAPLRQRPAHETVTAGVVDDNADFGEYLAYRQRRAGLPVRERDVSERYLLEVTDAQGRPVHDAEVALQRPGVAEPVMWARTDTRGRVWLHPRAFLPGGLVDTRSLGVAVRKDGTQGRAVLSAGQPHAVQVRLAAAPAPQRPRLDLVFMVDATGSMGDEIAKLKSSMHAISQQIARLPGQPDICYGLVAYRDRGDAFLTRTHDFTDDLGAFQQMLARVHAGGGGDTPEALNEALHEVVHRLDWRADAARMVVLVADAPPHLDYGGPQYDLDMQAALAKGIKLFAVGASGLDPVGEYVYRQIAQYTGGRFVFLTYKTATDPGSGPGTQTVHDVKQYSVQTLDRLIVRMVSEEMARLPRS